MIEDFNDLHDEYEEDEWYFCPFCMSGDIEPSENLLLDGTEMQCKQCKKHWIAYD